MTQFDPRMDKQRLLELNRLEHDFLRRTVDALPADLVLRPGVMGEWCVKDILAHVAAWETRFVGWVDAVEQGERPDRPAEGFTREVIDALNAETYAANRDRPLTDVLADFEASFRRFQRRIATLPEVALLQPGYYAMTGKYTLWQFAAANGFEHYREHAEAIREWANQQLAG
ncbi:MAG: hypothetical protein Kow0077_31440 [Anaerolineae bacterium]